MRQSNLNPFHTQKYACGEGDLQHESQYACVRHVFLRVPNHDGAESEGPNLVAPELGTQKYVCGGGWFPT